MLRTTVIIVLASCVALFGCSPCPECPCLERSAVSTDGDGSVGDAALDDTDGGVVTSIFASKPQPVTSFELHGRAGFDKVSVFSAPDMESPRLGYLRKGTRTRLGDPQYASEGCPRGWYKLAEGGFVCQGRGMLVGTKPRYIPRVPPPARVDELDPYRHGFIRRDWTPVYKRVPAAEELWSPPVRETDTDAVQSAGDAGAPEPEVIPHSEEGADGGVDYNRYARRFRAIRRFLSRGFWISVSERRFEESIHQYFYETVKGDYVPGDAVHLIKPPRFKGYEVLGESPLPGAIVRDRHASFFRPRRGRYRGIGPVERLSVYRVHEQAQDRRMSFYRIDGDRWLRSDQVEFFELERPPAEVADKEKWIRVDLSRQVLVAYEGAMPVYATLISSGLPESEETVTPTGEFSIRFKHLTDDMAGSVGDGEVYSVEDVPWVQYIHRNIAFHASFWHSSYGRPKSHGCINLSPADARWLFDWSDPQLPPGWHGVAATEKRPGTRVIVEGKTPQ